MAEQNIPPTPLSLLNGNGEMRLQQEVPWMATTAKQRQMVGLARGPYSMA